MTALERASLAHQEWDTQGFAKSLLLSPNEEGFFELQQDLLLHDDDNEIRTMVHQHFPPGEHKLEAELFVALFRYIAHVDVEEDEYGGRYGRNPVLDFENMVVAYSHAASLFQSRGSGWFTPSIKKLSSFLVSLAVRADSVSLDSKRTRSVETTHILIRPFGIAAADRGTDTPDKRDATFHLANLLFKLYYDIDNMRLCATIVQNITNHLPRLSSFSRADQTMFHFWRGRIFLTEQKLRQAHQKLSLAFDMCTNECMQNKGIIFIYLTAASLPLGIFPSPELISFFAPSIESTLFSALTIAIKLGDISGYRAALEDGRAWFAKRGLYLLLREKGEVLIWRSLIRRTLLLQKERTPELFLPTSPKPPTLALSDILTALVFSSEDESYDMDDVECMLCSLIDQGYIKGYLLRSVGALVLGKSKFSNASIGVNGARTSTSTNGHGGGLLSVESQGFPPPSSIHIAGSIGDAGLDGLGEDE